MYLYITFILSLFITIALIPIAKSVAFRTNLVDMPDARKVHVLPMPRSGGISMAIGVFVSLLLRVPKNNFVWSVFIGCFLIVAFGVSVLSFVTIVFFAYKCGNMTIAFYSTVLAIVFNTL